MISIMGMPDVKRVITYEGRLEDPDEMVFLDSFDQLCSMVKKDGFRLTTHMGRDPRKYRCSICGGGWESSCRSMRDYQFLYSAPLGREHVHLSCYKNHLAMKNFELFSNAIKTAWVSCDGLKEIPDEYGGAWGTPWYITNLFNVNVMVKGQRDRRVSLPEGTTLKMGRRKRVYSISLSSPVPLLAVEDEATKGLLHDNVTRALATVDPKDAFTSLMVHAWTDEKVREYVRGVAWMLGHQP